MEEAAGMMQAGYIEIPEQVLQQAHGNAWNKSSMAAHDAEDRQTKYIGSKEEAGRITDYYKDSCGEYWYGTRYREPDGTIVSEEAHIFGRDFTERERERRRRRRIERKKAGAPAADYADCRNANRTMVD